MPMATQQGQQMPPAMPKANAEPTPQNPDRNTQEQSEESWGLTPDETDTVVNGIIKPIRARWSTNRILQMPTWLRNFEFDRGRQILGWDPVSRTYFDAVAWCRQNNQETDYSYLEKYINNITQAVRRNFTAAVGRAVPPVIVRPENAENLADMTTAKAAQEAISIVESANDVRGMLNLEAQYLYLFGVYFRRTRFIIDATWLGYKEEPEYGDVEAQITEEHFHCTSCGVDTNAAQVDTSDPENMQCGNCGSKVGPQDFYPGESSTVIGKIGTKKRANGLPKWSVYSPLQIDTDPTKECLADVSLLALEQENDAAEIRATFPNKKDEITEGAESATNDNGTYDRLVRTSLFSSSGNVAADIFEARGTFAQIWVQPKAYDELTGPDQQPLIQKLQQRFPEGLRVSMYGAKVLDMAKAILSKEWTACKLHRGYGLYPPSVADNVVPFNERFNNISNILDDYMERCATGITIVDPRRLDMREMSGKPLTGGVLTGVPSVGEGINQPLANSIYHFQFQLDPGLFNYLDRLWNYCQLISGVPPQVGGTGTMQGVETAKGQKQMLDQAMGSLGDIYDAIKTEHAEAGQNAIECLQQNMSYTGSLWSVIEENGSEFRNNYVHLDEMQGRVRVKANTDEGLPLSPEQKRDWIQNMLELAEKNPVAQAWFDETANQQLANDYIGLPGSVSPGASQRSKTLQDVGKLLQAGENARQPMYQIGPDGRVVMDSDGMPMIKPPVAPEKWVEDYTILKPTVAEFCRENCDVKGKNPVGWAYVIAFYRLACQYEAQVQGEQNKLKMQAEQAGQPPPPKPDPVIQQVEAEGLKQAMGAVDRLAQQGSMPPLGPSASIAGQVSANRELVDSVAKLLTK
jgi:hypothetical protein